VLARPTLDMVYWCTKFDNSSFRRSRHDWGPQYVNGSRDPDTPPQGRGQSQIHELGLATETYLPNLIYVVPLVTKIGNVTQNVQNGVV